MTISQQLYQLQELDEELDLNQRALSEANAQIGESEEVLRVRSELASGLKRLEGLKKEQQAIEWQTDDLKAKIVAAEESLYSGRITSPKELKGLQQDVTSLKARCGHLEDGTLELMEQIEETEAATSGLKAKLEALEARWHTEQAELALRVEGLKAVISELQSKRKLLLNDIDSAVADIYEGLRKQRGRAVARVEQGICGGCRISLSVSELQRARGGHLVQCSSCGRILYFA